MTSALPQFDWVALLKFATPLLMLFATAVVILINSAISDDDESPVPGALAIVGLLSALVLAWFLWPLADTHTQAGFILDRVTMIGWAISIISAIFAALLSMPYLGARDAPKPDFYCLLLFAVFGMGVLVAGYDLIVILLGLEIMSISAYALTGYMKERPASIEGALKYFLMGAFATAFIGMGIAFLFGSAGSTDLAIIAERSADVARGEGRAFFLFGVAMIIVGFGFKVALVPFHAWAPDAYDGAPTPVTSFMATGIKAAAFLAFMRFALAVSASSGVLWHHLMWALAVATMFFGNLAAIRQDNLKRMLAYSSIAHAGYILVVFPSISAGDSQAVRAIILYLISYVIMTAGAFAVVVAMGLVSNEPVDIRNLSGLGRKRPWLAAVFTLFLLSLAGFPPTLGFFGKYYLFLSAVKAGDTTLVVAAVMASVISVYYYLRPVVAMYFREKSDEPAGALSPAVVCVIAVAAMTVVVFGILPQNLVAFVQGSVF